MPLLADHYDHDGHDHYDHSLCFPASPEIRPRATSSADLKALTANIAKCEQPVVAIDTTGLVLSVNDPAFRLLKETPRHCVGEHVSLLIPELGDITCFEKYSSKGLTLAVNDEGVAIIILPPHKF